MRRVIVAGTCGVLLAACVPAKLVAVAPTATTETRFVSKLFLPRVSVVPGIGWRAILDAPHSLTLDGGDPPALRFAIVSGVFDPVSQQVRRPPKDLEAWILANPLLEATSTPVTVGGIDGVQIDARTVRAPKVPYALRGRLCPLPGCFGLFVAGVIIDGQTGSMFRLVLTKVNGQDLMIEMDAVGGDWPAFLSRTERVLATLRFAGTGS